MKQGYPFGLPKGIIKNIHIIPKNLMKNGSFDFDQDNFEDNTNVFKIKHEKRRAHSNIIGNSCNDYFCGDDDSEGDLNIIESNIDCRNHSNIRDILSLKKTEKEENIDRFNKANIKKKKHINLNKNKKININNIFNNIKYPNNPNNKNNKSLSTKNKLNKKYKEYNSNKMTNKSSILSKKYNKSIHSSTKDIRLNTINNDCENKQKIKINVKCINNFNSIGKSDKINDSNYMNSYRDNNISTNINSDSDRNLSNNITFGEKQHNKNPLKISSEFEYNKKNNQCYSNSSKIKAKYLSQFNSTSASSILGKKIYYNELQNAIDEIIISDFKLKEDKDKNIFDNENIDENEDNEEDNINKINVSYIGKYKTIEQIEKNIETQKVINMIINNNINKKGNKNNYFNRNNMQILSEILSTAKFGELETVKK